MPEFTLPEFVVEVTQRGAEDAQAQADALAGVFNLTPEKAQVLLERLPGIVTKPVSERVAESIARRFREVGMDARVRPNPLGSREKASAARDFSSFSASFPPPRPRPLPTREESPTRPALTSEPLEPFEPTPYDVWRTGHPPVAAPLTVGVPQRDSPDARTPPWESGRSTPATRRRGGSLRGKLLALAILPTLLAILGALVVVWFVVRPALYEQLLDSARNPAIATAASLSSALRGEAESAGQSLRLLETIQVARQTFPRDSISFIVATDPAGDPISGWFQQGLGFAGQSRALEEAIQTQALAAVAQDGAGARAERTGSFAAARGERLEIVAQPLLGAGGAAIGTVVVGVTDRAVTERVTRILLTTLLFSLIPLALAISFAALRSRALTRGLLTLTHRADEISRGNLDARVERVRSGDELEDLATALERLRISMLEAMTRLRRRRG